MAKGAEQGRRHGRGDERHQGQHREKGRRKQPRFEPDIEDHQFHQPSCIEQNPSAIVSWRVRPSRRPVRIGRRLAQHSHDEDAERLRNARLGLD